MSESSYILKEAIVIGAGISGLAVARWLKVSYLQELTPNDSIKANSLSLKTKKI
jgi:hypothetical protein